MAASSCFLRAYEAQMAEYTDAPDIYHRACALTVMGALLTRQKYRCVIAGGVPPRWTNLWTVLVGDAGESRKSTAIYMAESILIRLDPDLLAPNDGSPEGFLQHLANRHRAGSAPLPNGLGDASTIFIAAEFSTLLTHFQKSYAAALKPVLMEFYDVPPVYKKVLSRLQFSIPYPRVGILGGIAIELLPGKTSQEDWLGGFFSRTMLIQANRTKHNDVSRDVPDTVYDRLSEHLKACLRSWRRAQHERRRPRFAFSDDAVKVLKELPKPPPEPNLKLTLARASVHLMKIAAIEQIDEDPEAAVIGKAAAERALDFIRYWWKTAPEVIDECFARGREDFEGDRLAKRIHRYVIRHGGRAAWSNVMRNCALHSREMQQAVQSLQDAEQVHVEVSDDTNAKILVLGPAAPGQVEFGIAPKVKAKKIEDLVRFGKFDPPS